MKEPNQSSRRQLVKSSILGLLVASIPNIAQSNKGSFLNLQQTLDAAPHERFPAIRLELASEVVGVAHFNLERVRELVNRRPELAKAEWDWGFGDWESAIAAASHVGRRDIVQFLISKGAVPTIFTSAMLGEYEMVKTMLEAYPGMQRNFGPHGISLLQHAKTGLQVDGVNKAKAQQLCDYLQSLGDADGRQYANMEESQKLKYLGDYKYGTGKEEGFTIKLNMRKLMALGRIGKSGGSLLEIGPDEFTYQGAPSVHVKFLVEKGKVISFTLTEPDLTLTATKI